MAQLIRAQVLYAMKLGSELHRIPMAKKQNISLSIYLHDSIVHTGVIFFLSATLKALRMRLLALKVKQARNHGKDSNETNGNCQFCKRILQNARATKGISSYSKSTLLNII